ncbi:hypothetical protein C7120_10785 [Prevotella sp. oral taxon 376]|uniref:hypothetical protein n=1 Tax=Prevotella sp. oral taxon 376 TaxID=712466 RepID=UPI000D1D5C3C|nr:hypothetical protein [Prevotella sp. oral taxon 376]PTL32767.1 hypothetical protein C7120_10785 [Prevotella sp. oral taxon 376]
MKRYVSLICGVLFACLGINAQHIVTFDFTTEESIKSYYPAYSETSRDFKKITTPSPVVIKSSFSDNKSGFYLINNNVGQMRVYKSDAITISVQEGNTIQSLKFIGGNLAYLQYNNKDIAGGGVKECTLTNFTNGESVKLSSRASSANISKIIVTYSDASNMLSLSQKNDNYSLLTSFLGKKTTVTLVDRKLSSTYWNTFCVPFDVDANLVKTVFGENTEIREFSSVQNSTLLFTKTDHLEAGKGYLIKADVNSPKFTDVTISTASPIDQTIQGCSFVGTFGTYEMATDGTELFFDSEDKLYKPIESDKIIYGFRAFVKTRQPGAKVHLVDQTTRIGKINSDVGDENAVYSISGVRMNNEKLPEGIYIRNGRKIIIR